MTESFDTEKSTVLCYNPCDTSAFPDSDSQKTNVEIDKYDGSEESSIGEISEETDPAGLEDTRDSREDTTPQEDALSQNCLLKIDISTNRCIRTIRIRHPIWGIDIGTDKNIYACQYSNNYIAV